MVRVDLSKWPRQCFKQVKSQKTTNVKIQAMLAVSLLVIIYLNANRHGSSIEPGFPSTRA